MAAYESKDLSLPWQHCVPLLGITANLPSHFQHGFQSSDLVLTTISSFEDHLVLGTNVGVVYLIHLPSLHIVKLKCENALNRISCLSAIRSVDDLIGVGNIDGCINVFVLPRLLTTHHSGSPAPRAGLGRDLKRFCVSSLHKSAVRSLAWSCNGLRLVSGDVGGVVGLIEVDYDTGQCVARHLTTEPASVVQLAYWKQVVAVSTEERCLLYCVQTGDVTPVGSKGRHGRYGVAWAPHHPDGDAATTTTSSSSCCVYTGRPGQRVWRADTTGAVSATLLIKDMPLPTRIHLTEQQEEQAELSAALRFENICVLETGQLVLSDSDSVVIFNPNTLQVEAFVYEKNFCRSVSSSRDAIFILNKDSKLFCISSKPLNIGMNTVGVNHKGSSNDALVSPATLKKMGSKLFQQGSSFMGNVSKFGGVIASKVSEVATEGNIVNGYFEDLQDNYSRNLSGELNTVTKQKIMSDPLSLESVAGVVKSPEHQKAPLTAEVTGPRSGDKVTESLYDFLPSATDAHTTQPLPPTDAQVESSPLCSPYSSPLVIRRKTKLKNKRKTGDRNSPQTRESSPFTSSPVGGASPLTVTSPSYVAPLATPQEILENEHKLGELLGIDCLKKSGVCPNGIYVRGKEPFDVRNGLQLAEDKETVEKIEQLVDNKEQSIENIEQLKENMAILCGEQKIKAAPLNSFSVDKFTSETESKPFITNELDHVDKEDTDVSIACNVIRHVETPTSVRESTSLVPATEIVRHVNQSGELSSLHSDGGVSLCYGPPSGSSVPSLYSVNTNINQQGNGSNSRDNHINNTEYGNKLENSDIAFDNDDCCETLNASLSSTDERDLDYCADGKPSDATGKCMPLLMQYVTLTHAASITDNKPYSPAETDIDPCEHWMTMDLPSKARSICASDDSLIYLDYENCLYVGSVDHGNKSCSWKKVCLPFVACLVNVSESGKTLWLVSEGIVYECTKSLGKEDNGHLYQLNLLPLAKEVHQLCGSDQHLYYIKLDHKVYCLTRRGQTAAAVVSVSCEGRHNFVRISCRRGLLWATDDAGQVLFRIGQTTENSLGNAWGIMRTDETVMNFSDPQSPISSDDRHRTISSASYSSQSSSYCFLDQSPSTGDSSCSSEDLNGSGVSLICHKYSRTTTDSEDVTPSCSPISDVSAATTAAPVPCPVTVCVGGGGVGWRLGAHGSLSFRPGISCTIPQGANIRWWRVQSAVHCSPSTALVAGTSRHLWLGEEGGAVVALRPVEAVGAVWESVGREQWSSVSAESLYGSHGALACLAPTGSLMIINPATGIPLPIPAPDSSPIVCISQRPESLWLLSASGDVWLRTGLTHAATLGTAWHQLDLHQISDVHLCHLSLGSEVVWGVDTRGGVYVRQGSTCPPQPSACPMAWLQVDHTALPQQATFTKVFAGPGQSLVWAVDSRHRVYARVAIFSELAIGVAWEPVPGVLAIHLSISESGAVFAVTVSGAVYRRDGVDPPHNYIGTRWVLLPATLARVSVSVDGSLWGLSQHGRLCRQRRLHSLRWREEGEQGLHQHTDQSWELV